MTDPRRSLLMAGTLALAACGGTQGGELVRPKDPTAGQALGEKRSDCKLASGYVEAYVVDWDASARLDLEAGMRGGLVPIRYTCDEFRIVKGCNVRGDYGYVGVSRKEQVIKIGNAAEVEANFRVGVGQYQAAVERGSAIDLAMVLVGKRSSTAGAITRDLAEGACDEATHVVTASSLGAFAVATGSSGNIAAAAEVFQLGKAGASTSSSKQALSRDGELEACQKSSPSDAGPPDQCQSAIRVELLPILEPPGQAAERPPPPPPKDALRNPCPPGTVLASDKCSTPAAVESYQCEITDTTVCEQQCDRGNLPSCYQLARALSGSYSGVKIAPDKPRSLGLMKRACEGDVAAACNVYAVNLMYPDDRAANKAELATARGVLERSCVELGHALSCISLADEYNEKKGLFGKDGKKRLEYYQRSCNLGDADGCDAVGGMYASGSKQVPRDLVAAEAAWMRSCLGETDTGRCVLFGEVLAAGKDGFRKDPAKAMWLFRRGCNLNPLSCKELGDAHASGVEGAPDPARAKQAYARACAADRADDEVCAKAK